MTSVSISPNFPPADSTRVLFHLSSFWSLTSTPTADTRLRTNPVLTKSSQSSWVSTMLSPLPSRLLGWTATWRQWSCILYRKPCFSSKLMHSSVIFTRRSPFSASFIMFSTDPTSHAGIDMMAFKPDSYKYIASVQQSLFNLNINRKRWPMQIDQSIYWNMLETNETSNTRQYMCKWVQETQSSPTFKWHTCRIHWRHVFMKVHEHIFKKTLPASKALQASWHGHETWASKALLIRIVTTMNNVASKTMLQTLSGSWSMQGAMYETWMESCDKQSCSSLKHIKFMYDTKMWAHQASSHDMHGQMTWWTLSMENNESSSKTLVVMSCRARGDGTCSAGDDGRCPGWRSWKRLCPHSKGILREKKSIYFSHSVICFFLSCDSLKWSWKKKHIDFGVLNVEFQQYDNSNKWLTELIVSPS